MCNYSIMKLIKIIPMVSLIVLLILSIYLFSKKNTKSNIETFLPACSIGDTRDVSVPSINDLLHATRGDPLDTTEYKYCVEPICERGMTLTDLSNYFDKNMKSTKQITAKKDHLSKIKSLLLTVGEPQGVTEAEWEKYRIRFNTNINQKMSWRIYTDLIERAFNITGKDNHKRIPLVDYIKAPLPAMDPGKRVDLFITNFRRVKKGIDMLLAKATEELIFVLDGSNCRNAGIGGRDMNGSCALDSTITGDTLVTACNKICQSRIGCKAFVIKRSDKGNQCILKSKIIRTDQNPGEKSYRPMRGCDSDNWTVKTLVNSYSGNRKNAPNNKIIIPMKGPIGMNESGRIEFSYTFWIKINRKDKNWRAVFRRGPQHPEDTQKSGRWAIEESREPGVFIFPGNWGAGTGLHIRFGLSMGSWNEGVNISHRNINLGQWHHVAITLENSVFLKTYVDSKITNKTTFPQPVAINLRTNTPITVGGGNEGGFDYTKYNNNNTDKSAGFNLKNLQVFRTAITQDYINSLYMSNKQENVFGHEPIYEDFVNKCSNCNIDSNDCDTGFECLKPTGISDEVYAQKRQELRDVIIKANTTYGPGRRKKQIYAHVMLDGIKIRSFAELRSLRKTVPFDCESNKAKISTGYCYDSGGRHGAKEAKADFNLGNIPIHPVGKQGYDGPAKTLVDSIVNHEYINTDSSTTKCKVQNPVQMVYVNTPATYSDARSYCKSIGRDLVSFAGAEGKGEGWNGGNDGKMHMIDTVNRRSEGERHLGVTKAKRINDYKYAQLKELVHSQGDTDAKKTFKDGGIWVANNDIKTEGLQLNNDGQPGPIPHAINTAHRINAGSFTEDEGVVDRIHPKGFQPCQNWTKDSPHSRNDTVRGSGPADTNIYKKYGDSKNWCYTEDISTRWQKEKGEDQPALWHGREPNNSGGQDCTNLVKWGGVKSNPQGENNRGIKLDDIRCLTKLPFVCEKEIDDPTTLGSNVCEDTVTK